MDERTDDKKGNRDPVCGMTVTKENAACSYEYKGKTFYFCAQSCRDEFAASPDKYVRQL
jgi:Cu+-exporting ATPase